MDYWMDRKMDGWMDKKLMVGCMDRKKQMDGWMDG